MKVTWLAREQNMMWLSRTRTQTTQSRGERTNHGLSSLHPISFPELRSLWPAVVKQELWEHPFQACVIACHRCRLRLRNEPDNQNLVIFYRYFKLDAPSALVFWPLVKGNEALGTRLAYIMPYKEYSKPSIMSGNDGGQKNSEPCTSHVTQNPIHNCTQTPSHGWEKCSLIHTFLSKRKTTLHLRFRLIEDLNHETSYTYAAQIACILRLHTFFLFCITLNKWNSNFFTEFWTWQSNRGKDFQGVFLWEKPRLDS